MRILIHIHRRTHITCSHAYTYKCIFTFTFTYKYIDIFYISIYCACTYIANFCTRRHWKNCMCVAIITLISAIITDIIIAIVIVGTVITVGFPLLHILLLPLFLRSLYVQIIIIVVTLAVILPIIVEINTVNTITLLLLLLLLLLFFLLFILNARNQPKFTAKLTVSLRIRQILANISMGIS